MVLQSHLAAHLHTTNHTSELLVQLVGMLSELPPGCECFVAMCTEKCLARFFVHVKLVALQGYLAREIFVAKFTKIFFDSVMCFLVMFKS